MVHLELVHKSQLFAVNELVAHNDWTELFRCKSRHWETMFGEENHSRVGSIIQVRTISHVRVAVQVTPTYSELLLKLDCNISQF